MEELRNAGVTIVNGEPLRLTWREKASDTEGYVRLPYKIIDKAS